MQIYYIPNGSGFLSQLFYILKKYMYFSPMTLFWYQKKKKKKWVLYLLFLPREHSCLFVPKKCKALTKELMKTADALQCRILFFYLFILLWFCDLVSYLYILQSRNFLQKANFEKISQFLNALDTHKFVRSPAMLFHLHFL